MNLSTSLCLPLLLVSFCASGAVTILQDGRLHLGRQGEFEWEHFKDRKVDGESLSISFQAGANDGEFALRLWQADVKLSWPVLLNGRRLGTLTTAETPLECVLAVPPGSLRDGMSELVLQAPTQLDDIEIGPVILEKRPVSEAMGGSTVTVIVSDEEAAQAIPCRITVTRKDGTLQPLRAEPAEEVAVRTGVVYARAGRAVISLPPGNYVIHAGRGFEWGVAKADINLAAGSNETLRLGIRREVDTRGWVAADTHIHTFTHSRHGDATIGERMLTIAGEGIEFAVATDHNHHTDYDPVAREKMLRQHFTPVIGNEVTTRMGHFNAFPVRLGAGLPDYQELDWARLMPAIRSVPGVKVVTLNHPRDVHSGFVPLGAVLFNPVTGVHRNAAALDVDALEVVTSAAMQSDTHLLFRDWFALLNRGHRIAAIGSSDTHDVNRFILGQGRTYVAGRDDDAGKLDVDEICRSYKEDRLLVSLGLLVTLKVDGRFGVGDLATGLADQIEVEADVIGPSWVTADKVELFANGILLRAESIKNGGHAGLKARYAWRLPRPAHDVHLVAIASGPGVTHPFWEIPRPYQPSSKKLNPRVIAATNPVWIDASNDEQFQSAHQVATELVRKNGSDPERLRTALQSCDQAVAIQVESLLSSQPSRP